jgi:hypothetical protein
MRSRLVRSPSLSHSLSRATALPLRARALRAGLAALTLVAVGLVGACNGENEGQPCDYYAPDLGSSDCNAPLVCARSPNQGISGYRCCPSDPRMATTVECSAVTAALDSGSLGPPSASDAGAADAGDGGASDAGDGGGADGPVESGSDGEAGAAEAGGMDASEAGPAAEAGETGEAGEAGDAASPADATLE